MPDSPIAWSLAELGSAYRRRVLSPVDVVEALFAAIARDGGRVNAFALLDEERALAAARAAEQRFAAGTPRGPLDGVPVSIKDLTAVAGWPTRRGSLATEGEPAAAEDAPAVASLRAGGAVIFGKTATSEFGWAAISDCPHTGRTLNPLTPAHTAGGSSSGAAAQVAAGWGPAALGSDAGGSIRIPASYCGLVGFKPSYGFVPQAPLSAFGDLSHQGPLARSIEDCRIFTMAIGRPDPRDQSSLFPRAPAGEGGRRRIGWMRRLGEQTAPLAPAIDEALRKAAEALARAGYEIGEIAWPGLDPGGAMWTSWQARTLESHVDWPEDRLARLSPRLRALAARGRALDAATVARSRQTLRQAIDRVSASFAEIDVLLLPATPDAAFLAGDLAPRSDPRFDEIEASGNWLAANPYCYPFNLTGQPALVLPVGAMPDGRPFGLQLVGRKFADHRLLDFGTTLQALCRG